MGAAVADQHTDSNRDHDGSDLVHGVKSEEWDCQKIWWSHYLFVLLHSETRGNSKILTKTKRNMKKFKLFCCHFEGGELSLWNQRLLPGEEVFAKVLGEHFHNKKIVLKHPKTGMTYDHEIVGKPSNGVYLIRVFNQRVKSEDVYFKGKKIDHPFLFVFINLAGKVPLIMIQQHEAVIESADEAALVLEHSLNNALKKSKWTLRLMPNKKDKVDVSLYEALIMSANDNFSRQKPTDTARPKAESVFVMGLTSARDRKLVIRIIEGDMGAMDNNENTMRAMCAAYSAEIIAKPKHKNFEARYGEVIAESTFNRYLRQKDSIYNGDGAYGTLLDEFRKIKGRNHDSF